MFVLSKRSIILPGPDGAPSVRLKRGEMAVIPDPVADTPYFQALVADGKVVPTGRSDRETQAAEEKKAKVRRGKAVTEE